MGKHLPQNRYWFFKKSCHQIMDQIWGTHKAGKESAYAWLNQEFGSRLQEQNFHFSRIDDFVLLKDVYRRMRELKRAYESRVSAEQNESEWSSWAENEFGEDRISRRRFKSSRSEQGADSFY